MADLIDRDAVIEEYCADCCSMFGTTICENGGMCRDIDVLKKVPAVNRWIPCSERLPVLYVPVMILTDDGSYEIAHVTENEDEYLWFGDCGHYSKDYVLFWMPLPEPPEKE